MATTAIAAPREWDAQGNPVQANTTGAREWDATGKPVSTAFTPEQSRQQYGAGGSTFSGMPDGVDPNRMGQAVIHSKMLGIPTSAAYNSDQEIIQQLNKRGIKAASSPSDIARDIKSGFQSSIIGLSYRNRLADTIPPNMHDEFISGLSTMVSDLPFYIGGGLLGGAAGSEVPLIGNAAGASMGAFAVPAAIRKSLVLGIQKGDITSFSDLMERTGESIWAGTAGAATGLFIEWAGTGTFGMKALGPVAGPAAEAVFKKLQQATALTVLGNATEGKIPNLQDFAINAALLVAMHYTLGSLDKAQELTPKVQSNVQDAYVVSGAHPAGVAAEALRQAQESPTENVLDRVAELTRQEAPPERQEATSDTQEGEKVSEPSAAPPASLRPAIRAEDGTVTPGGEGEFHPDIVERTGEDGERGFQLRNDEFLTRDQARAWLRENEPEVFKFWEQSAGGADEEFHTTDYNEAVRRSTGVKNASVDAQRAQMGLPPIESPVRSLDPNNWEQAKEDVTSGRVDPLGIAKSINKFPRGLSPEETNALNYYRAQLSNEHKTVMDAIDKARDDDDPQAEQRARERLQGVEDKINTVDQATKKAGTEWGLTGLMRQRTVAEDYSLDRLIQRARVASPNGAVPVGVRDQLESLSSQLDIANKKLEEAQSKKSQNDAKETVEKIKRTTEREGRKTARKQERIDLDGEFSNLVKEFDSLIMGRMSANPFFDPEVLGVIGKMAKNRVESGLTRIEDIVDYVHEKLTDLGHDVSKRDIRDAISGYGKTVEMGKDAINIALREAKRQGKLLSALEDAQAKVAPLRSGLQRDAASDRVRELQKQVKQAMRESGIDVKPTATPEQQWKSALDSVKTRLRNQITDLTKQLQTGEKPDGSSSPIPLDAEGKALQDARDNLRIKIRQEAIETRLKLRAMLQGLEGKPGVHPEQKLKTAMDATQRSIDEYERRIKENDLTPSQKRAGAPETPELKALRERRDALQETYREMQKAAKPKKSPEQTALDRYKQNLTNRIADLERQYATGDFTKQPQQKATLDPEATEMKLKAERLRDRINDTIKKNELSNRTTTEKAVSFATKWRRAALLTSWRVLGKLQSAAMLRMGVTPIEELNGGILSHIPGIDKVSARAPSEGGGLNISAEAKALSQFWQRATADDVWETLKTGKSSIDVLYGTKETLPPTMLDFIGHLHGALKVLPKRAEFFRRSEKITQWALDHNLDINDPRVQAAISSKAYDASMRAILMQDNPVTSAYQAMLTVLESKGAKPLATTLRFLLPIVKVPTNFVSESLAYTPGGLAWQSLQLFKILTDENKLGRSAMDNLTMHDMDNVMRGLKKGSIGLALMATGFALRKNITGYYRTKQKAGDPPLGSIKVGNITIPPWLAESPALAALQLGATMGHVSDHYNMKGVSGGLIAGLGYGTAGIVKSTPFVSETARLADAARTPESLGVAAGELTGNLVVPLLASQIAVARDPMGYKRKAKTFTDAVKLQVPGLREQVAGSGSTKKRYSIKRGAFQ